MLIRGVVSSPVRGVVDAPVKGEGGPLPLYQGLVATRTRAHNTSGSTLTWVMARTAHIARDALSSFKIKVASWYQPSGPGAGSEVGNGDVLTYEVSVEYPAGVISRATHQGSNTGACPDLSSIDFDAVHSIPRGATFWVRMYVLNAAAGIPYAGYPSAALGDGFESGTGAPGTNKVMSGTVAAGGGRLGPIAIIGATTRPSVLIVGDSIAEGTAESSTTDEDYDVGSIARWIGPSFAYSNMSQGGSACVPMNADLTKTALRRALAAYCSDVILPLGLNDLVSFQGAAAMKTAYEGLIAAYKTAGAQRVWLCSVTPLTVTSSDSFATLAGQTVHANAAARVTRNGVIRANGYAGMSGYFEVSDVVESSRDSGKFIVDGNPNTYTVADGVHMTGAAYRLVGTALQGDALTKLSVRP